MKKTILACGLFLTSLFGVEEYETWWEHSIDNGVSIQTFNEWLGGIKDPSRVAMRNHVKGKQYGSLLDVAAGLCIDYQGLLFDKIEISYTGVDITPKLVTRGKELGINIELGDIKALPFSDNLFDVVYARHILEHLASYEQAVEEMIRVAKKEVLVTFFIKPKEQYKGYSYISFGHKVYGNTYSKSEIEDYLTAHESVAAFEWENVSKRDVILHIYL